MDSRYLIILLVLELLVISIAIYAWVKSNQKVGIMQFRGIMWIITAIVFIVWLSFNDEKKYDKNWLMIHIPIWILIVVFGILFVSKAITSKILFIFIFILTTIATGVEFWGVWGFSLIPKKPDNKDPAKKPDNKDPAKKPDGDGGNENPPPATTYNVHVQMRIQIINDEGKVKTINKWAYNKPYDDNTTTLKKVLSEACDAYMEHDKTWVTQRMVDEGQSGAVNTRTDYTVQGFKNKYVNENSRLDRIFIDIKIDPPDDYTTHKNIRLNARFPGKKVNL